MIAKINKIKILEVFVKNSLKGFSIREIAREIKLAYPSVRNYIKELADENFITGKEKYGKVLYFANRESRKFRNFKIYYNMDLLYSTGLLDYVNEKLGYPTIILYGSFSRGEDTDRSDIDLVIITKESSLDLSKYEKKLNHELHIIFLRNLKEIRNKELKLNIINGIVLEGGINEI